MIPPIDVRQFRDCAICYAFVRDYMNNSNYCGVYETECAVCRGGGDGCVHHYTFAEMQERIWEYQKGILTGEIDRRIGETVEWVEKYPGNKSLYLLVQLFEQQKLELLHKIDIKERLLAEIQKHAKNAATREGYFEYDDGYRDGIDLALDLLEEK